MSGLFLLSWRQLRLRPLRSILTLFSVSLGVALYTSIDIVNNSTLSSFQSGIEALSGKAQVSISGGENGFEESMLEAAEKVPGVAAAIPLIETRVYHSSAGRTETLTILGIDLLKESSVRAYRTDSGNLLEDPLVFLNQPDSLILTRSFAESHGIRKGGVVRLATALGLKTFTVRGLLEPEGPARAYGGNVGIMDIDGARVQFGKLGKIDRIDIIPRAGIPLDQVRESLKQRFEPGLEVESPATQADGMRRLVEGYQGLLQFIGLLALIVGLFLVMNTTTITITERRREFGILRAIGSPTHSLLLLLLIESLILGSVGSGLGVLLGKFLALRTSGMVTHALSMQYLIPVHLQGLSLSWHQWAKGILLGGGVALLATLIAGRLALKIEPVEAVRGVSPALPLANRFTPVLGFTCLLLILLDARLGWSNDFSIFRTLNPFFLIFGAVWTSPALVRGLIRAVRIAIPSAAIRLGADQLLRNPRRTGGNIMTLMTGLMLVIVLSLTNRSIKHSLNLWFDRTLAADLIISSSGKLLSFQVQPLADSIRQEIDRLPGVDVTAGTGATGLRYIKQKFQGFTLGLKAFDRPHPRIGHRLFDITSGDPDQVFRRFFDESAPTILVSQNFVLKFKKNPGESVELQTPTGLRRFEIIGVVAEFTNPEGVFYINRSHYRKYWLDDLVSGFFVMAKSGVDPLSIRSSLDSTLGKQRGLMAMLNSELASEARSMVDQSFAYTRAVEASALLVGLFGLFNTLLISVLERRREFGVLRAVGMTRSQLIRMIVGEGVIQGLTGGLVAVAIGVFATYFWIMGTLSALLGWVLRFSAPVDALLPTLGFGLMVGVLASLIPARSIAAIEIRDALDSE
jgi:putative ABC transport system permease protein